MLINIPITIPWHHVFRSQVILFSRMLKSTCWFKIMPPFGWPHSPSGLLHELHPLSSSTKLAGTSHVSPNLDNAYLKDFWSDLMSQTLPTSLNALPGVVTMSESMNIYQWLCTCRDRTMPHQRWLGAFSLMASTSVKDDGNLKLWGVIFGMMKNISLSGLHILCHT